MPVSRTHKGDTLYRSLFMLCANEPPENVMYAIGRLFSVHMVKNNLHQYTEEALDTMRLHVEECVSRAKAGGNYEI